MQICTYILMVFYKNTAYDFIIITLNRLICIYGIRHRPLSWCQRSLVIQAAGSLSFALTYCTSGKRLFPAGNYFMSKPHPPGLVKIFSWQCELCLALIGGRKLKCNCVSGRKPQLSCTYQCFQIIFFLHFIIFNMWLFKLPFW